MRTERQIYDFDVASISCPTFFYVGELDASCMTQGAPFMSNRVPGAKLTVLPKVGHLGLVFPTRFEGILRDILPARQEVSDRCEAMEGDGSSISTMCSASTVAVADMFASTLPSVPERAAGRSRWLRCMVRTSA